MEETSSKKKVLLYLAVAFILAIFATKLVQKRRARSGEIVDVEIQVIET